MLSNYLLGISIYFMGIVILAINTGEVLVVINLGFIGVPVVCLIYVLISILSELPPEWKNESPHGASSAGRKRLFPL